MTHRHSVFVVLTQYINNGSQTTQKTFMTYFQWIIKSIHFQSCELIYKTIPNRNSIIQTMIDCNFCHSAFKESYLFTQCSHLVCIDCAAQKWDQKYSMRCCEKTTYLDDDTCTSLLSLNVKQSLNFQTQAKENINPSVQVSKTAQKPKISIKNEQKIYIQPKDLEESVLVREYQPAVAQLIDESQKRKEQNLILMQGILCDEVAKVKLSFQMYRKDLERREQIMLKQIYNRYSDHLSNLKSSGSDEEVDQLRQKLMKISICEPPLSERQIAKQDKILEKLDYNQQIMRQRLNKHYTLLK